MKRLNYRRATVAVIAVLALVAGGVSYLCLHDPMPDVASRRADALAWLRHEFRLPEEKMARLERMHAAYQDVCAEHCLAILDAREELERVRAKPGSEAEIAAAAAEAARVDVVCRVSTEAHLREMADVIGGEEGRRYLAIVLPRLVSYDHEGPATLDMRMGHSHDAPAGE